jgi:hypothetical protein
MSKADLYQTLNNVYEITLGVKGRKSGRDIPRPVWFVHEGNPLYLLPNYGSSKKVKAKLKSRFFSWSELSNYFSRDKKCPGRQ